MAVATAGAPRMGKLYFSAGEQANWLTDETKIRERIDTLCRETGLTVPNEPIVNDAKGRVILCALWSEELGRYLQPAANALPADVRLSRTAGRVRDAKAGYQEDHLKAVTTYLGVMVDKLADFNSVQCTWNYIDGERVATLVQPPDFRNDLGLCRGQSVQRRRWRMAEDPWGYCRRYRDVVDQ